MRRKWKAKRKGRQIKAMDRKTKRRSKTSRKGRINEKESQEKIKTGIRKEVVRIMNERQVYG